MKSRNKNEPVTISIDEYQDMVRFLEKEISNDGALREVANVISKSYLNNVLRDINEIEGVMREIYLSWEFVDAIATLASKLKLLGYSSVIETLVKGYTDIVDFNRYGEDTKAMFERTGYDTESDRIALAAIYFLYRNNSTGMKREQETINKEEQ